MKPIRKSAKKVLDTLTEGLTELGDHRTVDNSPGSFMSVHVEYVERYEMGPVFSVAHYYEQNGDLMRDPEMLFVRGFDGNYYPFYFRQDPFTEQYSVDLASFGYVIRMVGIKRKMQADHAHFAGIWLMNIKDQQGL